MTCSLPTTSAQYTRRRDVQLRLSTVDEEQREPAAAQPDRRGTDQRPLPEVRQPVPQRHHRERQDEPQQREAAHELGRSRRRLAENRDDRGQPNP
jgi:hypothetical protein